MSCFTIYTLQHTTSNTRVSPKRSICFAGIKVPYSPPTHQSISKLKGVRDDAKRTRGGGCFLKGWQNYGKLLRFVAGEGRARDDWGKCEKCRSRRGKFAARSSLYYVHKGMFGVVDYLNILRVNDRRDVFAFFWRNLKVLWFSRIRIVLEFDILYVVDVLKFNLVFKV